VNVKLNAQQTQAVATRRKDDAMAAKIAIGFCLFAAAIVGTYAGVLFGADGLEKVVAHHYDFWTCVILALVGWMVRSAGGHKGVIITMTVLASFIILTLHQEQLIRYLVLAALLFSIGVYGMCQSRNAVRVLMSIELMLNAVNINLIAFSRYVDPVHIRGQLFSIFVLTIAAAEAAVGLAIVLSLYRNTSTVDMDRFNLLKH
jgi:NAD(P)H-quinone oxidoreductase subunit 4L